MHYPRDVEILAANSSGVTDNNLRVLIKTDNDNLEIIHKEKGVEITPVTPLPRNQKFTIVIPQSERQPIFNLNTGGNDSSEAFSVPLKAFIDGESTDPVRIFLFNFDRSSSVDRPIMSLNGDTSYLNGINFTPVTENDSTMLFCQEIQDRLNIPDGTVKIEDISDQECDIIVKELLGEHFEDKLNKGKVEKGEGKSFWNEEKIISTTLEAGHQIFLQRHILQDFGFEGKFYLKTAGAKQFVIFRGFRGCRKVVYRHTL
jgi:hypothetical protein